MKNKINLGSLILIALCAGGILSGNAFAKQNEDKNGGGGNGIEDIYMTSYDLNSLDNFLKKDSFQEDETPWLYLRLKDSVNQVTGDWWFWNKGNQERLLSFDTTDLSKSLWDKRESGNSDGTKNLWLTRLDIEDVTASDKWWKINNVHSSNPKGGGAVKYHVTPEPISSALFLLGAGALAGVRKLRGK